jgi:hypothetical protein
MVPNQQPLLGDAERTTMRLAAACPSRLRMPPPKPVPLTVRPRRLTASLAPALIVMPLTPPETTAPASPTPSLMTLIALLMVSAP